MTVSWLTDRGQLNHNWLQNGVLVALNHARVITSDKVRAKNVRHTLEEDIMHWPERRKAMLTLLLRFEREMSPNVYFGVPPLSRCPRNIKRWLIPFTHKQWLMRESVKEKIGTALDAYKSVERAFLGALTTLKKLPVPTTASDLRRLDQPLNNMISACESLSGAISALPHRITCC